MPDTTPTFEFTYEGEFEGLSADVVFRTQLSYLAVLNEIVQYEAPGSELSFKVTGTNQGSLKIDHLIELGATGTLFLVDHYSTIVTAFKILGDIIKLNKYLRKEDIKKSDIPTQSVQDSVQLQIIGNSGPVTFHPGAVQIYANNLVVNEELNKTGRLLKTAPEIKGIHVLDNTSNKKVISIDREDIEALDTPNVFLDGQDSQDQLYHNQVLVIKNANFYPPKKKGARWIWEFIYRNRVIKASIHDDSFQARINGGEKLSQGDRLIVNLKAGLTYDNLLQTYVESNKFGVVNVISIIPRDSDNQSSIPVK